MGASDKPRWQGDQESLARAVNEQPWEPLPGMHKRRCRECEYWYADARKRGKAMCPDCRDLAKQGKTYGGKFRPSKVKHASLAADLRPDATPDAGDAAPACDRPPG